jgi:ubiquinone/menaquinone biosynthesis C-methylase UbiE
VSIDRARYLAEHYGLRAVYFPLIKAWHIALDPRRRLSPRELGIANQRFRHLLERDLSNVERGVYPRELLFDFPLLRYLARVPWGLVEFPRIFWRRRNERVVDLPSVPDRALYPEYYLRNFHWQSDGWFSERSARLYDAGVEALFMGTADVMRRMAIPPVVEACERSGERFPRILDVACGTGRFLGQIRRTLAHARLYGLDLSPFYVDEAKATLRCVKGVSLVTDNAEHMPFQDGYFDVVTSVFLFHELPRDARRRVMREVLRTLRPGASFVLLDSAQLAESGEICGILEEFPTLYHEPYYRGYLKDDLALALEGEGFEIDRVESHFLAKVVVARKPRD